MQALIGSPSRAGSHIHSPTGMPSSPSHALSHALTAMPSSHSHALSHALTALLSAMRSQPCSHLHDLRPHPGGAPAVCRPHVYSRASPPPRFRADVLIPLLRTRLPARRPHPLAR